MTPPQPLPPPTDEDRRKAGLLAEGGRFAPELVDVFAQGIAIARTGGDVQAYLLSVVVNVEPVVTKP